MTFYDDWRVNRITLRNMRRFEHLEIDFSPRTTVLVGTNGSGKTAVLDAIAIVLSTVVREFEGDTQGFVTRDVRNRAAELSSVGGVARLDPIYPVEVNIDATLAGEQFNWSRSRSSLKGRTSWGNSLVRQFARDIAGEARFTLTDTPRMPVIANYGVERLIGVRRANGAITASRFGAYSAALDPKSDLTRLSGFLEGIAAQLTGAVAFGDEPPRGARAQFDAIDEACGAVLASTGWGKPRWNPVLKQLTLSHPVQGSLPLSWLATGTKIAAGLAIDLASRMARANPLIGARELLDSTPGIVMIDEVDLHLHPIWQQQIVTSLSNTFPRVQFILTTHSPQVISTVEARDIRILDEEGVHQPEFAAGLRSDVVLRTVQGTTPEPDVEYRKQLNSYMHLVYADEGTSDAARELRRMVEANLGGIAQVEELAEADAIIAVSDLGI
jgi:predicted ATP-binding protein involved in virulence